MQVEHNDSVFLIDVAVINPLATANVDAATRQPGGAATAYELVKHQRYGAEVVAEANSRMVLTPMVVDMFGAWGDAAQEPLKIFANAYADRWGRHLRSSASIVRST